MSRISIDVTAEEKARLKALAALQGKTIKEFVLSSTLGAAKDEEERALRELEAILDKRIANAKAGGVSTRTVGEIFEDVYRENDRGPGHA